MAYTPEQQAAYESKDNYVGNEIANLIYTGKRYGKLAVAHNLLLMGKDLDFINKVTELEFSEIDDFQQEFIKYQGEPKPINKVLQISLATDATALQKAAQSETWRLYYRRELLLQEQVELIIDAKDESRLKIANHLLEIGMSLNEVAQTTQTDIELITELKNNGLEAALQALNRTKEADRLKRAKNFLLLGMNTKATAKAVELPEEKIIELQALEKSVNISNCHDKEIAFRKAYQEAYQEAYQKAYQEGYEEGYEEVKLKAAKNMLIMNMGIDIIVKCTGLPLDRVRELQESM